MYKLGLAIGLLLAVCGPVAAAPKAQLETVIEPTCADLMAAIRVADAGVSPTPKRKAQAEEAQDDIATALFWLHGWQTARGNASLPVKRDWMVAELKRVTAACEANSPDGTALISMIATQ